MSFLQCLVVNVLNDMGYLEDFSLPSLVILTSKFLELRNLIKQLFHSRLLDMRLVIANSALSLRVSLAIYHLISKARSWNNC